MYSQVETILLRLEQDIRSFWDYMPEDMIYINPSEGMELPANARYAVIGLGEEIAIANQTPTHDEAQLNFGITGRFEVEENLDVRLEQLRLADTARQNLTASPEYADTAYLPIVRGVLLEPTKPNDNWFEVGIVFECKIAVQRGLL